jgi:hypothetical protein
MHHSGLAARELRIDHQRIAHRIESLGKARIRKLALKPFHQRLIQTGEEFQHAVDDESAIGFVASMTGLPATFAIPAARSASGAAVPLTANTNQLAEIRGIGEAADSVDAVLAAPVL